VVQFNGPDRYIATLDPPSEGGVLEYAESPRSRMQRFLLRSVAPHDAPLVVIDFLAYEARRTPEDRKQFLRANLNSSFLRSP
jgi:hypothetical protein